MNKNKTKKYQLKIYKKGREVYNHYTFSSRRFLLTLKAINFVDLRKNGPYSIYLNVSYGKKEDVWGNMVKFDNSGTYTTKEKLWQAYRAFTEK